MPGSVTSVFSEAEDFETALREEGCLGLLVTGPGAFRARLTQVALHRLRLSAAEEYLPRVALVTVPADMILIVLPYGNGPPPIWGGIGMRTSDIMTLGAGQRLHTRTDGPSRWGSIWLPAAALVRYGSALTGAIFAVPSAARWLLPRPAMRRHLRHLHSARVPLERLGDRGPEIPSSAVHTFTDPDDYAASIGATKAEVTVTGRGQFTANLTRIDLHRLWMQQFSDNLPRVAHSASMTGRAIISFRNKPGPSFLWSGAEMHPTDIMRSSEGGSCYPGRPARAPCRCWWSMRQLSGKHWPDAT
jgi:hypothetical protein